MIAMEERETVYFRQKDHRSTSILPVLLRPPVEASQKMSMSLPAHIEAIMRRTNAVKFIAQPLIEGRLLPFYHLEKSTAYMRKTWTLGLADALAMRWPNYHRQCFISAFEPIVPTANCARSGSEKAICVGCKDMLCGKCVGPPPNVKETGQIPSAGDELRARLRKRMEMAQSKRAKKPFK